MLYDSLQRYLIIKRCWKIYFDVLEVISTPERIGELIAIREHSDGKYFVVVYREVSSEDGFIITTFLTRRIRQLERRRLIWHRNQQ